MNPFHWTGRIDAEETGVTTRWHHRVKPLDDRATGGVALIGFPVDEGVRRNGGRVGAADGPRAVRAALANLPIMGEPALWDAGDAGCSDGDLEAAQDKLAQRVAAAIAQGCRPLVLGGGHEVAWGTFQGIVRARPDLQHILVVNFDAHFDLRQAAQANSGTPFRQIAEWCHAHDRPFDYRVLGISRYANTQALFDRAQELNVHHAFDEDLQTDRGVAAARDGLRTALQRCDAVYLTVCLDVLPGFQAPGVSAPAALGVPLGQVLALLDTVLACGKVVAADIAELNPNSDRDSLTAKTAARIAALIARNVR